MLRFMSFFGGMALEGIRFFGFPSGLRKWYHRCDNTQGDMNVFWDPLSSFNPSGHVRCLPVNGKLHRVEQNIWTRTCTQLTLG
jgi:hypothetical protein